LVLAVYPLSHSKKSSRAIIAGSITWKLDPPSDLEHERRQPACNTPPWAIDVARVPGGLAAAPE